MARALLDSGAVELGIIATAGVTHFTRRDYGQVQQWLVPAGVRADLDGLPPARLLKGIVDAVAEFSPDVVHTWGTEGCWGLLSARGIIKHRALLDTQGLKGMIARVFDGGLSPLEQFACTGFKELVRGSTIPQVKRRFRRWKRFEDEIIAGHRFITTQSPWLEAQVRAVNPGGKIFANDFLLRAPFYSSAEWARSGAPTIFCSAAYPAPFKGLHVAIRALSHLRRRMPDVRMRIAGELRRPGVRQDGYVSWLIREAERLGVNQRVDWIGPLTAKALVAELQAAAVVVIPTYVEGYCLALAEAMSVGVPAVVAFVGGTSHLGKNEETCLFFPPGDEVMCASQIERVLRDTTLASRLSRNGRQVSQVRNEPRHVIEMQLTIYRTVLAAGNTSPGHLAGTGKNPE